MNTLTPSQTVLRSPAKTIRIGFIPTQVSGVAYYRMAQFAWEMRKRKNVFTATAPFSFDHLESNPWQQDMLDNPHVITQIEGICAWADVLVWQPLYYPHSFEFFEEMRTRYQKPFLMEMDDYVSDIPPENMAFDYFRPSSVNYKCSIASVRSADALIVSTPYLAEQYKNDNANIFVQPNSIDFKGLTGRPKVIGWDSISVRRHDYIRIGWIGGATHSADLELIERSIVRVLEKYPEAWFYCIHGSTPAIRRMTKYQKVYWTSKWCKINLYPRYLASYGFDIGIAPLVDNNFNRGKSNLRWLEYSAMKIPTIASPLPDFKRVIDHGENGFLARDEKDWEDLLSFLIEVEGTRRTVGQKAYETVKAEFNVRKTAQNYLNFLRTFI